MIFCFASNESEIETIKKIGDNPPETLGGSVIGYKNISPHHVTHYRAGPSNEWIIEGDFSSPQSIDTIASAIATVRGISFEDAKNKISLFGNMTKESAKAYVESNGWDN